MPPNLNFMSLIMTTMTQLTLVFLSASTTSVDMSGFFFCFEIIFSFRTSSACLRHSSAVRVRIDAAIFSQSVLFCGHKARTAN